MPADPVRSPSSTPPVPTTAAKALFAELVRLDQTGEVIPSIDGLTDHEAVMWSALSAASPELYAHWAEVLNGRLVDALLDLPEFRQVPEIQVHSFVDDLLGLEDRT